jgi:hypothetical protein
MEGVRQILLLFSIVAILLFVAGCAQKIVCSPPNVLIGDVCCIDADSNNLCDSWGEEEEVEVVPVEDIERPEQQEPEPFDEFAQTFADTWDRKSYTALHNLFIDDVKMKVSSKEFNFLARKIDKNLGIEEVSLVDVEDDVAEYEVVLTGKKITVFGDIDEEDDSYRHDAFYFFEELSADAACGEDSECFMSFAVLSGDRNYCDNAGELKADCIAEFGVSKDVTGKIDECMTITEYYGRAECLTQTAVNENSI